MTEKKPVRGEESVRERNTSDKHNNSVYNDRTERALNNNIMYAYYRLEKSQ